MMGVVVDDLDAAAPAAELEAAVDTAERADPGHDAIEPPGPGRCVGCCDAELRTHPGGTDHRGDRVERHVLAREREDDRSILDIRAERRGEPDRGGSAASARLPGRHGRDVADGRRQRGVGPPSVTEDLHPARGERLGDAAGQGGRARVVEAHDERPAARDARDEPVEHLDIGLDGTEEVEVVGVDVGDDDDVGCVLQQRAVALVGLGDEDRVATVVGVGPRLVQLAADRERRVGPGMLQRDDRHRGRGGLAVGARDQQAALTRHQLGQDAGP